MEAQTLLEKYAHLIKLLKLLIENNVFIFEKYLRKRSSAANTNLCII
jgi:hypothetical protein